MCKILRGLFVQLTICPDRFEILRLNTTVPEKLESYITDNDIQVCGWYGYMSHLH